MFKPTRKARRRGDKTQTLNLQTDQQLFDLLSGLIFEILKSELKKKK